MARGSWPTGVRSAALVRLLAQMTAVEATGPEPSFVETLGRWLHWTDAVALSGALGSGAVAPEGTAQPARATGATAAQREFDRVRSSLGAAIDDDSDIRSEPDLAVFRRHYMERQQTMDSAISALRKRLRAALARRSPGHARLAAADAALEAALAPRERAALSALPGLLDEHWRRANAADDRAGALPATQRAKDLRSLLHAELELRLQPVQGLLEALTADPPAPNPT